MDARPDRAASTTATARCASPSIRVRARFSAWYEMFPRSCTTDPRRSGTFREAEARLPDIAAMGFDVLYLPPVHPIGRTHRKGRNNALTATPGDPGSPWAIGSRGRRPHRDRARARHARRLRSVRRRRAATSASRSRSTSRSRRRPIIRGSREHPEWFRHRPDGSIKYAENPPKKYQDIYPFDFESRDAAALWAALRDVFLFWIGARRHDLPRRQPAHQVVPLLGVVHRRHQARASGRDLPGRGVHAAEGDALPREGRLHAVVHLLHLAQHRRRAPRVPDRADADRRCRSTCGRTSSPTRPTSCTSTCRRGGRPAFEVRLVLAATLSASYGIYSGFELCENVPVRPGSEEYLDSEKYQIKPRDWNQPGNLNELIARVNDDPPRSTRRCSRTTRCAFHDDRQPGAALVQQDRRPAIACSSSRTPTPTGCSTAGSQVPIGELGIAPDVSPTSSKTCWTTRATRGAATWNYVQARSGRTHGAHLRRFAI